MTTLFLILAVLGGTLVYVVQGIYHMSIYHLNDNRPVENMVEWWVNTTAFGIKGIHKAGDLQAFGLAAGLFSAFMACAEGWTGLAAAVLLTWAPFLLGSPLRQFYINQVEPDVFRPKWWKPVFGVAVAAAGVLLSVRPRVITDLIGALT